MLAQALAPNIEHKRLQFLHIRPKPRESLSLSSAEEHGWLPQSRPDERAHEFRSKKTLLEETAEGCPRRANTPSSPGLTPRAGLESPRAFLTRSEFLNPRRCLLTNKDHDPPSRAHRATDPAPFPESAKNGELQIDSAAPEPPPQLPEKPSSYSVRVSRRFEKGGPKMEASRPRSTAKLACLHPGSRIPHNGLRRCAHGN